MNLKVKIGIQGVILKLHKFVRDFLKITNFPPSTCVQSALPLCKCSGYNFVFLKIKMVEKEHLYLRKNGFF